MRVIGADLSLTSTGIVVSDGEMRRIRSRPPKEKRLDLQWARIRGIAQNAAGAAAGADLVVVEGLSFASQGAATRDLAGLWWTTVGEWLAAALPVAVVTPAARAKYATGRGNASKDAVLSAVVRRFPGWEVTGNDVADALILCAMGRDHLGDPLVAMPELHREALAKVAWPA